MTRYLPFQLSVFHELRYPGRSFCGRRQNQQAAAGGGRFGKKKINTTVLIGRTKRTLNNLRGPLGAIAI